MARLTTGQKAQRVIRFLLGMRRPRIAGALFSYGFTQETLDEGWTLLRSLVGEKLATPAPPSAPDPALLQRLDDWENKWFVVAEASLKRHHPEVRDVLFLNLSRTSGPEVAVSVNTLLQRFEALAAGSADEQAAHALLVSRGLSQDVVAEAKAMLEEVGAIADAPVPLVDEAAIAAAEDAMWAWYLEWGAIARLAINDGRLLRLLGYRGGRLASEPEEDDEPVDAPADDGAIVVPVP